MPDHPPAGPLAGVRVVELGVVIAGPAAAAVLADWGAEVVKLEPPEGDPQRGNWNTSYFEMDNRGKRSVALDLKTPDGARLARELIGRADVFVTNLRPDALRRLGLHADTLLEQFPRLVYASVTGYGEQGDAAGKAGYDIGAFWSRSGMALALAPRDGDPPVQRPGTGDHTTALGLAGGIAAALVGRDRTGAGRLVQVSLLRSGAYVLSSDLISQTHGLRPRAGLRRILFNPLLGAYRSGDDRWFWLLGVQAERHWPGLARAIGRPDLVDDPRFVGIAALLDNRRVLMEILDAAFAERTLDAWAVAFADEDVWWDPLNTFEDVLEDEVVRQAGVFRPIVDSDLLTVATPVDFSGERLGPAPRAPEAGEHTEQVLLDLGYDWAALADLKASGVIP